MTFRRSPRPGTGPGAAFGRGWRRVRPKVSAVYIVKNEEEFLPFSIRAIYHAVDEIVVVDNGSVDRTPAIAASFPKVKLVRSGAEDFSELWNLGLSQTTGDWFMFLAADEIFYPDLREAMPRLLSKPNVDAYYCWFYHLMKSYWYMQNSDDRDGLYYRTFLVRRVPRVRFEGRVHERLVGVGPTVQDSGLHYVHYGYTKPKPEILRKWKLYAYYEGQDHIYDGVEPESILEDRPLYPFTRGHPPVIQDYVEKRAAQLAARGYVLFRRPGS